MNLIIKKTFILIIASIILITSLMPQSTADENIQIVCTNATLADFTSNIITENVSIEYIMPAGACPSHFDTSPSDISKIVNADIIISLGWEPWLESLLNKSGNTEYNEIKCLGLGEWNIPTGALSYVKTIRDGLTNILPDEENEIDQNTNNYLAQINQTAQDLKDKIKNQNLTNRKIVSMQWQKDYLEWLGFEVSHSYPPPESLSVQDEIDVINAASEEGISAVVDNLQSGTAFGARVAGETGISHVIFTNFPGAFPNTDSYLEMISYNTDQLIEGITSFDQTSEQTKALQNQIDTLELQRNTFAVITLIAVILCIVLFMFYKRK